MHISDNNNFATWQYSQKNNFVFVFSLWFLAPRSLALELFKSPILLLLQLPQHFSHGGREGSIYPAKNVGQPQNLRGASIAKISWNTYATRQVCPVRTGQAGEVSYTGPNS